MLSHLQHITLLLLPRLRLTIVVAVLGLGGCSHGQARLDSEYSKIPVEYALDYLQAQTLENLFEHAKQLVELETNTQLGDVKLILVSDQTIQREVKNETARLIKSQFSNPQFASLYLEKSVGDQEGTYTAIYSHEQGSVLVSKLLLQAYRQSIPRYQTGNTTEQLNKALMVLLLHELVHAADDKLYKIHDNRILNFKSSFIQSAAFEGHAQLLTRKICRQQQCLEGMDTLEQFMFEEVETTDPIAQNVQAISRNVLEYSYIEGEKFLSELAKMPNGDSLIQQVMLNPPEDPVQILVPATYPDTDRAARNNLLKRTLTSVDHTWNSDPWAVIETSTIKGIDVRNDASRRDAAVEGFTKLIRSMTAAQIFNQDLKVIQPIDVMLIEAESQETALLFAESFVNSAANLIVDSGDTPDITQYPNAEQRYVELIVNSTSDDYASIVAISGKRVIQISGKLNSPADDTEGSISLARSFATKILTHNYQRQHTSN